MPAADEQQLLLRVKEGDHEAFRLLVARYMKQAYNIAYGFVNNHDDAEDIAQESFVRVHHSIRSFRGDARFGTWLYRIVMNLSLNRVKRRQGEVSREGVYMEAMMTQADNGLFAAPDPHVRMYVERALHQLPTLQRAVVILRHIDGLSTKQVSAILKCSEGTVKTHLHRGLKKMKRNLSFLEQETP